jgi:hypothetical protein
LVDVPVSDIPIVRPLVEHWIEEAQRDSAYATTADVWAAIKTGAAQLWLAWSDKPEAVCVTQLEITSKGKFCRIWIMVGQNMETWVGLMPELEAWAKREGCMMMRHEARPGWSKALKQYGYKMPHVVLEKEL